MHNNQTGSVHSGIFSLELSLTNTDQQEAVAVCFNLAVELVLGVSIEGLVEKRQSIISPASHAVVDLLGGPMRPGIAECFEFIHPAAYELFLRE